MWRCEMKTVSSQFFGMPGTKLGWWSVGLGILFVVLFLINSFVFMPTSSDAPWRQVILPFYGIFMMLCGLASGIVGLAAVIRQRERSWLGRVMLPAGLLTP